MNVIRHHHMRGQSLVEMALLLPVLLILSVVTFDLGRGIYYYSAIYNAAREGARYGIINPNDITNIKNKAVSMAIGVNLNPADVTVIPNPPNDTVDTIQVDIQYSFELVTPFARLFTQCACGKITLNAYSTMYVER
jgi:hypothetical protein